MQPNFIDLARRSQMDFPVQMVIRCLVAVCYMFSGRCEHNKTWKVKISGYAASGCGRGIERVYVYVDGCKTLMEAARSQK
ncbi:sulfite oxidase [Trifolium repens]|nr:sulfite oxidase [Trifolium repens]